MNDLESITERLEIAIDEIEEKPDARSISLGFAKEILAILKAQQPRAMTMKEAQKIENHDFIWIERHGDELLYCLEVVQACKSKGIVTEITLNSPTYLFTFSMDGYNDVWRCWTSRPTDEQREAVKWDADAS